MIQRDVAIDLSELLALPDPVLRQRLAAVLARGSQELNILEADRPPPVPPDWFNDLELAFDVHAAVELAEEGPIFYVHTWYLDASQAITCPVPKPVRLRADRRTWRSEILAVWQDQIRHLHHVHLFAVAPEPPRLPWMAPTLHVLLCQNMEETRAPVLVTAVDPSVEPLMYFQCMHYLPRRVSVADVMLAHFPTGGVSGPCRVRRGTLVFQAFQPAPIGPGDGLEIDLMVASSAVASSAISDDHSMLQMPPFARPPAARDAPVQISLDATIPCYPPVRVDHGFPELLYSEQDDWLARLQDVQIKFAPLPPGLHLHAASLHALQEPHAYLEPEYANRLALYVDGSARGVHAAWSVVAISYDWQGVPTLHGVVADRVSLNFEDPQWIGAESGDNVAAELTASVAAHLTALVLPYTMMSVIRPDLQLSARLSEASCYCTAHPALVQVTQWLGHWYHQQGGYCSEVRGHSSHPWNELADSLAKHVCFHASAIGLLDFSMCHEALKSGDIHWAGFQHQHPALRQSFPPSGVPTSWVVSPSLRHSAPDPPAPGNADSQWHRVAFDIASANVLALGCDTDLLPEESASSRAERLDAQWHAQGIAAIGLQESRRPQGRYATTHYIVFASGAQLCGQAPHYGCELWLHKTLPFMRGEPLPVTFADFRPAVSHADPRRLIVHLHAHSVSCSFVVLHAPCRSQHTGLAEVEQWWTDTAEILRKADLAPLTWILIDANAPLATHDCAHFARFGADPPNDQGALFERFLQDGDWYAPTTMPWCHVGMHTTWTHPRGSRLRRDYILCSARALEWCSSSWVDGAHDAGFSHEDHLPVILRIAGWWQTSPSSSRIVWDRHALLDPGRCKQFQEALRTLPVPSWEIFHINDHAAQFQQDVTNLSKQFFAKKAGARQRPRLAEATLSLIQLKRSVLDYGRQHDLLHCDAFRSELRSLERSVRACVREDQTKYYADLIDQLAHDGSIHDFRSVYQLLVRVGGRPRHRAGQGRPLPLLKDASGRPVTSFLEQQRLWLRQFADVEGGLPMSRDALHRLMPPSLGLPDHVIQLAAVPTQDQISAKIRRLKRGKAPGPDGIPAEIYKAGSAPMVQHVLALTTKTALHAREPDSWRGGRLIPLHKGRLPKLDPLGYRSIFVSNFVAKLYHSVLRDHLAQTWAASIQHIQFGGRTGCSSDTPHLIVQQHFEFAHARRLPSAALFVGFKAAFYSVIRQGLFGSTLDETSFMVAMHRLGVTPDDLSTLLRNADSDVATSGISHHVELLLVDLFRGTHFELDGLPEVALTSRGTRPGDPVGDILFNLLMVILMRDITADIQARTSLTWLGQCLPVSDVTTHDEVPIAAFCELAFVDDLAVLLRTETIDQLWPAAAHALTAVFAAAGKRGLSLNMEKGKTELLCALVGPGSKKAKQWLASSNFEIQVALPNGDHALRVVRTYKHLGAWVHDDAQPRQALRARVTSARQAWGPLLRPFFTKKVVAQATKVQVLNSLVLSRLTYNVHVLTRLSDKSLAEWEASLRPMVAPLATPHLKGLASFQFSTTTLCGLLEVLSPLDRLHLNRLRYCKRLLDHSPMVLWNLVHALQYEHDSWVASLRSSFAWFTRHFGPSHFPDASAPLVEWWTVVRLDHRWKGHLRRAQVACLAFRKAEAQGAIWEKSIQVQLQQDGALAALDAPPAISTSWTCDLCEVAFPTKRALAVHAAKHHHYRSVLQHFALDGHCPACCREFHQRSRLMAHLRTQHQCLHRLRACFPPLPAEVLHSLIAADKEHAKEMKLQGWLGTKALFPAWQTHGPGLPPAGSQAAALMLQRWSLRRPPDPAPLFETLQGRCDLDVEVDRASPAPLPDHGLCFVIQSTGYLEGDTGRYAMAGLARLHALLHIKSLCFVHFFSGYRRQGDLQACIENHHVQGAVHIFCLSIDYCLQNADGDLTAAANQAWWFDRVASGVICGVGGGPPCETYSAARLLPHGPPPLRSYDYMDGLPWNSRRGWEQTQVGSTLMRFFLHIVVMVARVGGCAFVEHPAFPTWAVRHRPASIWASRVLRWIRRLACSQIITFDQCVYDCCARKPTTMLLLRLSRMVQHTMSLGHMGRCPHPPGWHQTLSGRDSTGAFRTSVAKVYMPAMNAALADAVVSHALDCSVDGQRTESLAEDFEPLLTFDFVDPAVVQPDF